MPICSRWITKIDLIEDKIELDPVELVRVWVWVAVGGGTAQCKYDGNASWEKKTKNPLLPSHALDSRSQTWNGIYKYIYIYFCYIHLIWYVWYVLAPGTYAWDSATIVPRCCWASWWLWGRFCWGTCYKCLKRNRDGCIMIYSHANGRTVVWITKLKRACSWLGVTRTCGNHHRWSVELLLNVSAQGGLRYLHLYRDGNSEETS